MLRSTKPATCTAEPSAYRSAPASLRTRQRRSPRTRAPPPGNVVEFASVASAYQELVAGRIDAVVGTRASLGQIARETSGLFEIGPLAKTNVQIVWAVRKGNDALLDLLNDYIGRLRGTGALARLQFKYDLLGNGT